MKKLLTLFSFIVSICTFSQEEIYFGKKPFVQAEIIMENGDIKTGYLQNFQNPKYISADMPMLGGLEKKLKFEVKEFAFKEDKESSVEKIKIEDLKRIVILDNDGEEKLIFDKMKLKTINSKNEIIDLEKTVVLPLDEEGKNVNLYGINIVFIQNNRYTNNLYLPYLKNKNDEYGYILIDLNRVNFFNLGKLDDKLIKAVSEATKDCPEFTASLNDKIKFMGKESKIARSEAIQAKNKILKELKNSSDRDFQLMKIDKEFASKPFLDMVDEYHTKCKK